MDLDFWRRRWGKNEIAFHQRDINAHLQQFWSHLGLPWDRPCSCPCAARAWTCSG